MEWQRVLSGAVPSHRSLALLVAISAASCAALNAVLPTTDPLSDLKSRMAGGMIQEDSISSGLVTDTGPIDLEPPGYRVSWINWSSGFRKSGLQIGDRIIAIDGTPITRPATLEQRQKEFPMAIGQYQESERWKTRGTSDGAKIALTVRRRASNEGSQTVEVKGLLFSDRVFTNAEGRRTIGPGGPEELASDGFSEAWSSWYEKFVRRAQRVLDGGWQSSSMSTRPILAEHLEDKPRVDYLVQHFPAPFAEAVQQDFEQVRLSLVGRRYELDAAALAYRQMGEERAVQVADAGAKARAAFLQSLEGQVIPAFPTIDAIRGDRKQVAGKVIVLPAASNRDWVSEAGHGYIAWSGDGGAYFLDSYAPSATRLFEALFRYRKYVSPLIDETYAIIARIRPEPKMVVIDGTAVMGLSLEALGATVGDKMFVDLTKVDGGSSKFAGEDSLLKAPDIKMGNDATPRQVMEAFISALKNDDQRTWIGLFADWWAAKWRDDGSVIWYPYYEHHVDDDWVRSRQLIIDKVYDARVVYVGDVQRILTGKELPKGPVVDQVLVEIDHIGLFDGEYHAFKDVTVNRMWTLQRVNGGPWRIASVQGL